MNKSKNFSGQPIISQVLKFIPASIISRTAKKYMSDRYYKQFKTYDYLVTMIFATLRGSSSLREVSSIMLACEGKINHLGLSKTQNSAHCPMLIKNVQAACLLLFINPFIISTSIFYRTAILE
ncbi:DUF4372 domain-containing protein [Daejeonella sp.]|jgi:hypothetical protein|uniref:DUF4372 domain-containing protein n=1 Tax=Daejeonella sp. TaxID=2805397 RepID=UPI0037831775